MYDNIFLARNTFRDQAGYLTQQFAINDGGFKHLTSVSSADRWLNSINLASNLFSKHLSLYAGFGLTGNTSNNLLIQRDDPNVIYEYGVALNIVPKIFEIYFPIKLSSDLNQLTYAEKIRFTLNLNTLNPFQMFEQFGF